MKHSTPPVKRDRMLVFRIGHLGDMIVSLPAMWAIRQHWPQAHLTLLCNVQPGSNFVLGSDIVRNAGLFDGFEHYVVPRVGESPWVVAWRRLRLLLRIRAGEFGSLFYLSPSLRTPEQVERDRRFFRAAGVKEFYGMDYFPPVPGRASARPLAAAGHEADLILARLRADGIPVPPEGQGSLALGLGEPEEAEVTAWLCALPSDGGRTWLGIGPGSKMPSKRWPLERFREVVARLVETAAVWPVVFGGLEDREIGEALLHSWGCGYNAAGALGMRGAAQALKRCALYLGNDTGTMHLAALAGTPCVAVFSSRDWPGAWYPYGVEQRVFRSAIACEGCNLIECVERRNECLNRITAQEVFAACADLLEARNSFHAPVPIPRAFPALPG